MSEERKCNECGVAHDFHERWCSHAPEPTPTPARSEAAGGEGLSVRRAERDLRFYADRLCVDKPTKYEVWQTAEGTDVALSAAVRVVLAELTSLRQQLAAAREDGERYAEALRDIRDNYDHDEDAHKYNTGCRVCTAVTALRDAGDSRYWDDRAHEAAKAARSEPSGEDAMLSDSERTKLRLRVGAEVCTLLIRVQSAANHVARFRGDYDSDEYSALCRAAEEAEDALLLAIDRLREGGNG